MSTLAFNDDHATAVASRRSRAVDALRGFALLGIIIVHAAYFAGPHNGLPTGGPVDTVVKWLAMAFFSAKFFLIFTFLFGFGFATSMGRAARDGLNPTPRVMRRLAGLLALGAVHAVFFFAGDALMVYAILGFLLWLSRGWSHRALIIAASISLVIGVGVQALSMTLIHSGPLPPDPMPMPGTGYLGGFAEVARTRVAELPEIFLSNVLFHGPSAFAMFLFGLAMGRDGAFPPSRGTLEEHAPFLVAAFLVGAGASGITMAVAMGGLSIFVTEAAAAWAVAAPILSFGIASIALLLFTRHVESPVVQWLATAGGSSLSCYVLQSVVLGGVYYGWGLGWYGAVTPSAALGVALAAYVAIVLLLHAWHLRFRLGPLEWLLRSFVDLEWKPIRR